MTDHSKDPLGDPFDLLRTHVRAVALLEQPRTDADELVADITGSVDRADRSRAAQVLPLHGARSPRRRRWLVVASATAIAAVGGAGVAAYVSSQPADPVAGIVCRASADFGSTSVVLPIDDDPIAACANLWKTGDLPRLDQGGGSGEVPELAACTGGGGSVEVLPVADGETCETFGLVTAELRPDAAGAVETLARRLSDVHASGCIRVDELRAYAEAQLAELGLVDWKVVAPVADGCALAATDAASRTVSILEDPRPTPSPQESP